jgi:hypothetical protein
MLYVRNYYNYYYLTANGFLPGGSGTAVRQQTNNVRTIIVKVQLRKEISGRGSQGA